MACGAGVRQVPWMNFQLPSHRANLVDRSAHPIAGTPHEWRVN